MPVKTGLDRRHNYCRQSCAVGIMGKLIEYVLARRGIIVIISSLMQMISEIKETEQFKRYLFSDRIKVNVAHNGIISSPLE